MKLEFNEADAKIQLAQDLRLHHILADLSSANISEMVARAKFQNYNAGEIIFNQGAQGEHLFFILDGQVRVIDISQEPANLLAYLQGGEFFGQISLITGNPRNATIDVIVDATVAVFDRGDWNWLIGVDPDIPDKFTNLEEEYREKAETVFAGILPGEVVVRKDKRHILALTARLWGPIGLILLNLLIAVLLKEFGFEESAIRATYLIFAPFVIGWLIYAYIEWANDDFIITSERVIHIERTIIYGERRDEAPLSAVQDVGIAVPNMMARIFGYFYIHIQTAGVGNILFDGLRDGDVVQQEILNQRTHAQERIQSSDVISIRKALVNRMGWQTEKVAAGIDVPTEAVDKSKQTQRYPLFNYFIPRMREVDGDRITWRKHWVVLVRNITIPMLVLLGVLYLMLASSVGLFPFLQPRAGLALILLVVLAGVILWNFYQYDAWRKDIYVVTDTNLIDIKGSPLNIGPETRREGPFSNVQNTTYSTKSIWTRMLNMGDVIIETAGTMETFTFDQVFAYRDVQMEIAKRFLAFKEQERQRSRSEEEERYIRWLGEYHDLSGLSGEIKTNKENA